MIAIKLAHSHTHIPYSCFPNSGGGEEGSFGTLHFPSCQGRFTALFSELSGTGRQPPAQQVSGGSLVGSRVSG